MYPQPAPSPAPIDYAGIVVDCGLGIIASITDPNTLAVLSEYRNKVISESNGERSVTIVEKGVGALLRPNMPVNAILDVMDSPRGASICVGLGAWATRRAFLLARRPPSTGVKPWDRDRLLGGRAVPGTTGVWYNFGTGLPHPVERH